MKKLIFTLFICSFIVKETNAQLAVRVGPSMSFGLSSLNFKEFDSFANSYEEYVNNEYNDGDYKLKSLNTSFTSTFGFNGFIGPGFFDYDFGKILTKTQIDLKYGDYRKFDFKRFYSNFYHGIGFSSEVVYANIGIGVNFINAEIRSSYVYNGEIESFGEEKILNGIYSIFSSKISLGTRFGILIGERLMAGLKIDWLLSGNKSTALSYTDNSWGTSNSKEAINWNRLPKEYDPSQNNVTIDDSIKDTWSELLIKFTISYVITFGEL